MAAVRSDLQPDLHGQVGHPVRRGLAGAAVGRHARGAAETAGPARGRDGGAGAQGEGQSTAVQVIHVGVPHREGRQAADHPV